MSGRPGVTLVSRLFKRLFLRANSFLGHGDNVRLGTFMRCGLIEVFRLSLFFFFFGSILLSNFCRRNEEEGEEEAVVSKLLN